MGKGQWCLIQSRRDGGGEALTGWMWGARGETHQRWGLVLKLAGPFLLSVLGAGKFLLDYMIFSFRST